MKYTVLGMDGQRLTRLNENLAIKQKVTDEQLSALILSHQLRWLLFETAKGITEPLKLQMLANVFTALEFEQQKLWNFPQDQNFHRFFEFPGCKCPRLDNLEALGTPYRITAQNCPIHGFPERTA
jgi:hypothetical protein